MSALPVPLNVRAAEQAVFERPSDQRAPLPVANSTRSFWIDSSPDANRHASEGSDGPLTTDADVCIIGSGITGVSAAYHLAQTSAETTPLKVVILEARDFCSGATGRNGGHLAPHVFGSFPNRAEKYGTEEAIRAVAIEQHTASEIVKIITQNKKENDVDLVNGGRVELLFTEEEINAAEVDLVAARAAGVNMKGVGWLTKEEVQAKYGASYPGVHTPSHNVWPLKTVALLYELASSSPELNLTLHTRTPATSISPLDSGVSGSRRWNVTTPRGSVACSYVLHATNAYASHLLPHMQGAKGIIPTRGQIIATRAAVGLDELTTSGFLANEGYEYWFPRPVKEPGERPLVIFGGGRELLPDYEIYETDDSVVDPRVGAVLRKFLPSVFPGKYDEGTEPEMEWTGIMGFTASTDPFVGPVVDPASPVSAEYYKGQYIAAGYTGHGMPRAFACAEAVAQMIIMDIAGKPWSPPDWLPRHYITTSS